MYWLKLRKVVRKYGQIRRCLKKMHLLKVKMSQ